MRRLLRREEIGENFCREIFTKELLNFYFGLLQNELNTPIYSGGLL